MTDYTQLLNLLWRAGNFTGRAFTAVAGERIEIVSAGDYDEKAGVWHGAGVVVDGERRLGTVTVGEDVAMPEAAVLRITSGYARQVLGIDDRLVPQIEYAIESEILEYYDTLCAGATGHKCAGRIAAMEPLHRTELYTRLLVDRLRRKTDDVMGLFRKSNKDWAQVLHVMLFRAMGGNRNRESFTSLASKVTGAMVSREKGSQERVEALLLGASGLLHAAAEKDAYTLRLEEEFRHLAVKYSLVPLRPAEWELDKLYLANYPTVRLAEIAALLSKKEFMFDGMLACRISADVEKLFVAEASEYWTTHYKPGEVSKSTPKRIGKAKAHLIGINLVVPLMFAYGRETGSEELCEHAVDLLMTIPAEKNEKLDGWYGRGCTAGNGFESQALLQLSDEYCSKKACAACHIGRAEIKKVLQSLSYTINA